MIGSSVLKILLGGVAAGIGFVGLGQIIFIPESDKEETISTTKLTENENRIIQEEVKGDVLEEGRETKKSQQVSPSKEENKSGSSLPEKIEKPVIPQCFIYEVEAPITTRKGREVKRIIEEIKGGKEALLLMENQTTTFKNEIKQVCPDVMNTSKNVYVWRKSGWWQYAEDIQRKDWLKEPESSVSRPENLKVK